MPDRKGHYTNIADTTSLELADGMETAWDSIQRDGFRTASLPGQNGPLHQLSRHYPSTVALLHLADAAMPLWLIPMAVSLRISL